jgi:ABC-type Fe3+ transport system substrate-binding protein
VFDKTRTYQKSALGAQAFSTRSAALTPKLRSLLILVDGKRGHDELIKLGAMLGDVELLLDQLADLGFVEPAAGVAPAQAPAAPVSPVVPAASAPTAPAQVAVVPLAQAQRQAVRRLNDLLGPNAEELCLRIEAARNAHDYLVAVARAEGMVRQYRGERVAAQFAAEMASQRPA